MSTKRSFGRFTAMGLAGLTAVSSMAIVANAEAYPSNVYEFTYGGIDATIQFAGKVKSLELGNKYVDAATAADVFKKTSGFTFKSTALAGFMNIAGDFKTSANFSADNWTYKSVNALTGMPAIVVPAEYAEDRGKGLTFYFKSKAERDAAVNAIVNANTSEYKSKFGAASSALNNDFSATISAYKTDTTKKISDIQTAADKYFKDPANESNDTVLVTSLKDAAGNAFDLKYLDTSLTTIYRKSAGGDTSSQWASKQNSYISDKVKFLDDIATQAKTEFNEMYAVANYAFDDYKYAPKADCKAIIIDDSKTSVVFGEHIGQYIKPSTAKYQTLGGGTIDLTDCYYRTTGNYVNSKSYAFTGEIIDDNVREDTTGKYITPYLLDSDRWSDFSALIEGQPSDNGNTTESGNGGTSTTTPTTPTTVTGEWYPGDANYRTANTSGISYEGKNGKWYTSVGAAALYGGGYTGSSKTSNYSSVKSNSTLYFSADDGNYYKSASDAGSHSYLVKNTTTTSSTTNYNDPYYYYFMMGNGTTTIDPDAPAIYGSKKRSGWDRITSYIKASKTGATVKIDMNAATTVPASVLAAAKDKGVNLLFVNENGSKVTVKAGSVSTSSALDVAVTYNVKNVRSSLVKAAKKANPGTVSTAQIKVGTAGSLGGTATVTVKMSAKRAGDTVKAYRLTDSGKLTREALGVVKADGTLSFNVKNGGSYLLVVIE